MGKDARVQKKVAEVRRYLVKAKELVEVEGRVRINSGSWKDRVNKTQQFMAESGIGFAEIFETIKELTVENYSYTETDYNTNFLGEEFWFFGISKKFEDEVEDFYIKLKIRMLSEDEFLLIMSFHPEQPVTEEERLKFPYRTDKKL